ncbi:MAG: flagellar biosynthetic protein FliR [Acetivibrionales bacterium]
MQIPAGLLINGFDMFLLVLVRMTGLFVVAPIFGRRNIPAYMKVGFSFFISLILVNTTAIQAVQYDDNMLSYALLIIKEFLVGLTTGFIAYITYTAIYIAGEVIDMQIGFGVVNVMDPMSNIQVPVTSNVYFIISMLVLLSINGHHMLIKALFDSYKSLPPGSAVFDTDISDSLMNLFSTVFATGFKIAAPVVAAIFIADVALGTISRMVPQMNIFVIGMPLKIMVGLIILAITIPVFVSIMESVFGLMDAGISDYLKELVPG